MIVSIALPNTYAGDNEIKAIEMSRKNMVTYVFHCSFTNHPIFENILLTAHLKSQLNSLVYHLQLYHCIMNIFIIYLLIYSYSLKAKEKKHIINLQGVI